MNKIGFFLLIITMALVSCSKNNTDPYDPNNLVGSWENIDSGTGYLYTDVFTFNSNKTGREVYSEMNNGQSSSNIENFTWSTSGIFLTLISTDSQNGNDNVSGSYSYSISGNQLSINWGAGDVFIYTRK